MTNHILPKYVESEGVRGVQVSPLVVVLLYTDMTLNRDLDGFDQLIEAKTALLKIFSDNASGELKEGLESSHVGEEREIHRNAIKSAVMQAAADDDTITTLVNAFEKQKLTSGSFSDALDATLASASPDIPAIVHLSLENLDTLSHS